MSSEFCCLNRSIIIYCIFINADHPRIVSFFERMLIKLEPLLTEETEGTKEEQEINDSEIRTPLVGTEEKRKKKEEARQEEEEETEEERQKKEEEKEKREEEARKVIPSVCAFIKKSCESSHVSMLPCFYTLYPLLIQLGKIEVDDKLSDVCCESLSALARYWTRPKYVPVVLEAIDNASKSTSCSTLINNMQFLQVWLFHNMSTVLSDEHWIGLIRNMIIRLLEDDNVEIREQAAQMLTGMLYCSIFPDQDALLVSFHTNSKNLFIIDYFNSY